MELKFFINGTANNKIVIYLTLGCSYCDAVFQNI